MGNNADGQPGIAQQGQQIGMQQVNSQLQPALNTFNGWSPQQKQQFYGGMSDWYQSQPGRLQQDQQAVNAQPDPYGVQTPVAGDTTSQQQQFNEGLADWYQQTPGLLQEHQQAVNQQPPAVDPNDPMAVWGSWTPEQQQQLMGGLGDWYQQNPGLLEEHRQAVNQPPEVSDPLPTQGQWEDVYVEQPYETMNEWQKWQMRNPGKANRPPEEFDRDTWLWGIDPTENLQGYNQGQPAAGYGGRYSWGNQLGNYYESGGQVGGEEPTWQPEPLGPITPPIEDGSGNPLVPGGDLGGGDEWTYDPDGPAGPDEPYPTETPPTVTPDNPVDTLPEDPDTGEVVAPPEQRPEDEFYDVINDYYRNILGRDVGSPGYDFYASELRGGLSEGDLRDRLYYSDENLGQDPDYGWLQGQYQDLLGRDIDAAGRNFYMGDVNDIADIDRDQISSALRDSPEGKQYAIRSRFQQITGQEPNEEQMANFIKAEQQVGMNQLLSYMESFRQ
jgi:hypothetical protein